MFAPAESLPFGDRPVAERALSAQRAGAADRAETDPGRRPDRARRVRRRAGGLRPRLRAHAGGARPARLPAGLEQAAAAARDARDRGRRRRRGAARGARGDVQAGVRGDPPAPAARRSAAAVPAAPAGAAHARGRLRRHADDRAGRGDDADRHARGRLAKGLLPRLHAVGLAAARQVQPARGIRQRPQHDDPQRRGARLGQDHARPEAQVRGVPAGRAGDRLRPQGRPSLPSARGGRAAHGVRDAAPGPGAARRARPAARRARASAPGRGGVVPARPAAGAGRAGVGDGGRGRRRPRRQALARADLPARSCGRSSEGDETDAQVGRALEVYARSGLTQLGFADPRREAAAGRASPGHLPADPRPARAGAGHARARSTPRPSASASRSCG